MLVCRIEERIFHRDPILKHVGVYAIFARLALIFHLSSALGQVIPGRYSP